MKKHFIVCRLFIIFVFSLLLCACGDTQETETSWKADSLADNNGKLTTPPNGVPIITDPDQFQPVTEDQSYHFETDWQNYLGKTGSNSFLAVGEDSYYYYNGVFLYVFDPKQKRYAKLCNKPECTHEINVGCNAELRPAESNITGQNLFGLFYYNKNIYLIFEIPVFGDNDAEGHVTLRLYRISPDGTERTAVRDLVSFYTTEKETAVSYTFIQHRGYLYYAYVFQKEGQNDFYMGGSNVLYRVPMDGSGEPECIMPIPEDSDLTGTKLYGEGSYIYFCFSNRTDCMGEVYRFNTESDQVEKPDIPRIGNSLFCPISGTIYYQDGNVLYRYDPITNERKVLTDLSGEAKKRKLGYLVPNTDAILLYAWEYDDMRDSGFLEIGLDGRIKRYIQHPDWEENDILVGVEYPAGTEYMFFICNDDSGDGTSDQMGIGNTLYYLELSKSDGENPRFIQAN